jgi:TolB-like protein/rhodanese-related sulfurtransferase
VRDHIHGRLDLRFEELGTLNLKNIARPVDAFVVRSGDAEWAQDAPRAGSLPILSIDKAPRLSLVVLPFRNLSGNLDEDCLADAITHDLTTELARIPGILVVAHPSSAVYGNRPNDIKKVGQELGVRYAVEGVVRKLDGLLRIGVHLVSTLTGQHIWADRFERKIEDLAVAQDEIVRRISSTLDSRILDAETAISMRERPDTPDAFDLLFRAWSLFKKPDDSELLTHASELLEQALKLEPSLVPAMLSLADRLINRYVRFGTTDWGNDDVVEHAADLLAEVEKIEPNDEWLMFFQGSLLRAQGNWRAASLLLQRLVSLYPSNYSGHRMLGRCKMIMGHANDAIPQFQTSIHFDPSSHYNRLSYAMIGNCMLLLGNPAEAIGWLERGLEESPENERRSHAHQMLLLASAFALTSQMERARRAVAEANRCWPFATVRSLWPFYEPRGLPEPLYAEQMHRVREGLRLAGLRDHADEISDFGVSPSNILCPDLVGWTPPSCPGATTIRTSELVDLLARQKPLLFDVALGSWRKSIPGSIGLQGMGHGASFSDKVQNRFNRTMHDLTNGEPGKSIVVFCMNSERFTSYNLALRLVALGYTQVLWYRGGLEAWQANDLPETDLALHSW